MAFLSSFNCAAPSWALDTEEVFRNAVAYTVKIRTRITSDFIEDTKGTFTAAGFVVDAKRGWIMTNAHVVGRSPAVVSAAFIGQKSVKARKVYVDPHIDLAILEIDPDGGTTALVAAPLDCHGTPSIGHPVGAFGHPFGLDYTGTRGIISGVEADTSMLQMDAAINPGNSGGPLISLKTGMVVGINTASLEAEEEEPQNTNFAEPILFACKILDLLRNGKDPSPPNLRVVYYNSPIDRYALIVARTYLGPDCLDLKSGDEILGVDGFPNSISNERQLVHALRGNFADFKITVMREGKERVIRGSLHPQALITEKIGVLVSGLLFGPGHQHPDDSLIGAEEMMVIQAVDSGSVGEELSFEAGDLIVSIDGMRFSEPSKSFRYLSARKAAQTPIIVEIMRSSDGEPSRMEYMIRQLPINDLELIDSRSF
jgi:serine protease Do